MKKRKQTVFGLVLVLLVVSPAVFAQEVDPARHYSPFFTGLGTEFNLSVLPETDFPGNIQIDAVSLVYTWGMRTMLPYVPLRIRGGLGYWPGRDFSITAGIELGLFELLNSYQARMFGFYAMIDGIFRISTIHFEATYRPGLKLLVGINNLSCLGIGAAWDSALGWMLKLDYSAGIYLLKKASSY